MKKQSKSQAVANRFVGPGLRAIQAIKDGEVSVHDVVNLHMMTRLALRARTRNLVAPKPQIMEPLVKKLAAAISLKTSVALDEEEIATAEKWLRALAAQMGRTSMPNLLRLIEDLILIAEIRNLTFGVEDSEASIKNLANLDADDGSTPQPAETPPATDASAGTSEPELRP